MMPPMFPEDEKEERDANDAPPEPDSQNQTGPEYSSLIEYPKDAPAQSGEALVLEDESASVDQKLAATSTEPGIYLLRDRAGKVLYVGKAKSLRTRVRAYFREGGDGRFQVRFLMKRVRDFDTIVTASEKEALILENNLIKQYKPRYNIRLKDDKSYLSAKITNHAWPRITVTRKIVKDGGRYFGPFGSADGLRETIDVIRKVFPLRTCTDAVFRNRSRPCLEYQIKRCLGPCCLPVDREDYGRHLHAAQLLLEGKNLELLREMRDQMKDHASRLEFEDAARIRDRVHAIEKTVERQTVLHHWGIDEDVFGIYREGGYIEAIVLIVRGGKLTSTQGWSFQDLEFPVHEILSDLLTQYYSGARNIPDEVIMPVELEDAAVRAELLSERRGKKCEVIVPQRGEKLRLLEMAMDNARQSFASRRDNEKTREQMLEDLRVKLGLRNTPKRMECYDISNLQGSMVVGSQVTFDEGEPCKNLYRRYRIRSFEGQDDFASMYEVLKRRLERAVRENVYPDLWV
ncbi:MAG TPA: excinuclease ABC subunit UvrC, partial [Candidatus Binatus sp.]|nr:excinuclease ABC subunit UvrC [Candidatus Binatus sp.]